MAESSGPDAQPEAPRPPAGTARIAKPGLPLWMPLVGLVLAFLFAIGAGIMICPTLSALALPPDPPLPDMPTSLVSKVNKGAGLDEWLYTSAAPGCSVAKFYEERIGNCSYDPNSGCGGGAQVDPGFSYQVATCRGTQQIGTSKIFWTVYIATNYKSPEPNTQFRLIRELGN